MSLIDPSDTWSLWGVIAASVAASIYLEQHNRWAAKLSGAVIALILAMILANSGVMPPQAPVYDAVLDYLVPLAVALLLQQADLRRLLSMSRSMLVAFHLAACGTVVGAILAAAFFHGVLPSIAEISGLMAASYIGGAVNFTAVRETFNISFNLASPLLVADNFVMAAMFLALLMIADARFFRRRFPHPHSQDADAKGRAPEALAAEQWKPKPIGLLDIAVSLAVAAVVASLAVKIGALRLFSGEMAEAAGDWSRLGWGIAASLASSAYIWITLLGVGVATAMSKQLGRFHGSQELGGYLLYLYLFVIGLQADLWMVAKHAPSMFVFCALIALTNLGFTLLVGKALRLGLEELLLAVNATLGGAPTAAAMAVSKGWSALVLPSVLVAIWGYVIGTSVGIILVELLRRFA